jgi:hypothetical protein
MKKEIEGILGREGTQPCVKTDDGKTRLIYNLFDGFTGKKIKFTIEEVTEEEMEWIDIEEESEILEEPEIEMEEETEGEEKVVD